MAVKGGHPTARRILTTLTAGVLLAGLSACSSGGGDDSDQLDQRDTATFEQAINRTCNRLGLAFSQTDVQFLLDELASAISSTGYTPDEAINGLRSACPAKVNYANALP